MAYTKPLPPIEIVKQFITCFPDTGKIYSNKTGKQIGSLLSSGYLRVYIDNPFIQHRAHRVMWLWVYGEPVPNIIDHINKIKTDNRINNLRAATDSTNQANAGIWKNNTTGVKGVKIDRGSPNKPFVAYMYRNNQEIKLGQYYTLEEATNARRIAFEEMYGEFARHK